MSAMRRSPRWTAMAPPSYTVRPLQREKAQDSALLGLEPVGERLEAALLDAYPEPLLLGLVARTDRERRQDAALEATDPLERRDEPRACQVLACALGAFREQPRSEVARKGVAVRLVLRGGFLHVLAERAEPLLPFGLLCCAAEIGRAHVWTPVTIKTRIPSSACKKKKI